jgi:IclR family transcriptional regulator, pca regulon regulatory protein
MTSSTQLAHATDTSHLSSVEKSMHVLEELAAAGPATIAAVAERCGMDRAFVRRALLTFERMGYVVADGRRFTLSPRIFSTGCKYLSGLPFMNYGQPILEELSDRLSETASIGVLDDLDIVFVLRVPAKRFLSFDPSIGTRVPACLHSMGHVMLSELDDEALDARLSRITFPDFAGTAQMDRSRLREQIEAARANQWAFTSQQYEDGICGVSVPIVSVDSKVSAALNVSFPFNADAYRRAVEEIVPALRLAGNRLLKMQAK